MTRHPRQIHLMHPSAEGDGAASAPSNAKGMTAPAAKKLEDAFITGVRNGIRRVRAVPSPLEGTIYDFDGTNEFSREWDDREEARRQVKRAGDAVALSEMPVQRVLQYSVVRRSLFSAPKPRVSILCGCWSPIELLAAGPLPEYPNKPGTEPIEGILRSALVHERPNVYHYVAVCSTIGWRERVYEELPFGQNFSVALIEPRGPGWATFVSPEWPPALAAAIEPEDLDAKRARIQKILANAPELQAPGGLLLIEEVCERAVAPHDFAADVAVHFARTDASLVVELVEGSVIIRRRR